MENNPIFKAPNDMIADINTDSIQAPNSSVKMMQLFFTTETEKKFREMVKELQKEYNKSMLLIQFLLLLRKNINCIKMKMKTLTVEPILSDEEVKKLEGEFLSESHIKHLLTEDTIVYNEKRTISSI